jgi:hypothetical protein
VIIISCCLIGTGLHLGDCKIAIIVSLSIRLISCCKTPQNAGNSLSELHEIENFLGGCPQNPLDGSHLRCSTRLSQNPIVTGLICWYIYIYIYIIKICFFNTYKQNIDHLQGKRSQISVLILTPRRYRRIIFNKNGSYRGEFLLFLYLRRVRWISCVFRTLFN